MRLQMNSSFLLGWAIKQPLVEKATLPPVNWFCTFVDRQLGVPTRAPLSSELHLLPSARITGSHYCSHTDSINAGQSPHPLCPSSQDWFSCVRACAFLYEFWNKLWFYIWSVDTVNYTDWFFNFKPHLHAQ